MKPAFHVKDTFTDVGLRTGMFSFALRRYCTLNQKLASFVFYLKIINPFLKK